MKDNASLCEDLDGTSQRLVEGLEDARIRGTVFVP